MLSAVYHSQVKNSTDNQTHKTIKEDSAQRKNREIRGVVWPAEPPVHFWIKVI